MDSTNMEPEAPVPVIFGRPGKKRKIYRQRGTAATTDEPTAEDNSKGQDDSAAPAQPWSIIARDGGERSEATKDDEGDDGDRKKDDDSGSEDGKRTEKDDAEDDEDDEVGIAVAELIKRRKARRTKLGGVEFRGGDDRPSSDRSLVPSRLGDFDFDDMDLDFSSEPIPMDMRFAPQTGLIGELVNKHMEEYVEAQLAKRHQADAAQADAQGAVRGGAGSGLGSGAGSSGVGLSSEAREQLAMKGKLHEIDLGAEVRARNIAMTERASRRLRGTGDADDDGSGAGGSEGGGSGDKTRLGRDGKPLPRKRRGSDEIKRDQMVEQFLHENRMDVDVYDVSREPAPTTEGRPTDDRIAEQFRREFMDAVAQRMRRKRRPLGPPAKPKTRNEEEILRGPKLGGSRNVRSVMRDKLLQKQEEERHNMSLYEQQLQEQKRRANRRR